jgi:hypothetical protein
LAGCHQGSERLNAADRPKFQAHPAEFAAILLRHVSASRAKQKRWNFDLATCLKKWGPPLWRMAVCTENLIHVDEAAESPNLAQ